MGVARIALLAFVLLGSVLAHELDGDVYVLTTSGFNDFVDSEDISLVEFYAPWCGHCKSLAPEYAKAATTLKENKPAVKLAKVDATVESDLAQKFGVTSYPTMKVFRKGTPAEYKGPRDATGIVSYMQKQAAPSITIFKAIGDFQRFTHDEPALIYFGKAEGKAYKNFESTANKLRETYRFAQTDVPEILSALEHTDGEIVLYQANRYSQSRLEAAKVTYKDGDLASFIGKNILPLVGELTNDNQVVYNGRDLPLVKFYADLPWHLDYKGINYFMNKIRKVAKDFSDKFVFAVASKSKNSKEIDDAALPKGANQYDAPFVILHKGKKYPAPALFSADGLKAHLESFLESKLEPYIKSEPLPEQPEDGPAIVVGKNFDEIVLDPSKDVLLEAYAPWCGHCKTLEPKYKELAQKMKKYSDQLTIAKVDATANDLPSSFAVSGYPSIFWVPANKKNAPVKYDGGREIDDFVNYIKGHVSKPLKEEAGEEGTKEEKKGKKSKKSKEEL